MKLLGCAMCLFVGMTLSSSAFYFYLIISQYMISPTYQVHKQIVQKMVDQAKNLIAPPDQVDSNQVAIDIYLLEKKRNMVNSKNNTSFDHDLKKRIELFLVQLRSKLRSWELRSASILWRKENQYNHYNVTYRRSPPTYPSVDRLCTLTFRTIEPNQQPFSSNGFAKILPRVPLMQKLRSHFPRRDTCAIVTNSGSLIGAKKGQEIDSHDVIIRLNDAPTVGYEDDVGSRTSIRLLNSQVVSRSSFNISDSLYNSTFNLVWDPSQYNVDLAKWYKSPDHNFFPSYRAARLESPQVPFYIVHPQVIWDLWKQLQTSKGHRIMRTPPSSGFIGLFLAIRLCSYVYAYEYIPSIRLTERCHYYDNSTNLGCSFGDWHPLATEKLYALHLNTANDYDLAINGRLRTRGCG